MPPGPLLPVTGALPPEVLPPWLATTIALAACASLGVLAVTGVRWYRQLPLLPYQPRSPVPWGPFHLAFVVFMYLAVSNAGQGLVQSVLPPEVTQPAARADADEASNAHPVFILLAQADFRILWVCVLAAGLVAPITEELFFRLFLQGWLEAAEARLRGRIPDLKRLLPKAVGPIGLSALIFAAMHFRVADRMIDRDLATFNLAADASAKLLTVTLAIILLRSVFGVSVADLGWRRDEFFADVKLGLLAFLILAAPIQGLQAGLHYVLPPRFAPDAITLLPFGVALGILYHRTHRIVPAIVLHMSLNVTNLTMALLIIRD